MIGLIIPLLMIQFGCSHLFSDGVEEKANRPIRIGLSPWPGWYVWYLAEEKGFFKKYGLKVELKFFTVYSDSLQALSTGQIDANNQTMSDTLAPVAQGIPLKIILVTDHSQGGDGLVAKPNYKNIRELKGKTVATEFGTVDHLLLYKALQSAHMSEKDIQYYNMKVNDAGPPFLSGKLDAAVLWEPFLSQAVRSGKGRILYSTKQTPGLVADLLVARQELLKSRPKEVQNLLKAWFDALKWWQTHPEQAIDIMADRSQTPESIYRTLLNGVKMESLESNISAFGKNSKYSLYDSANQSMEFLKEKGVLKRDIRVESLLDDSWVRSIYRKEKTRMKKEE